ncbi:2-oxo acid dehydrogenase subunit E2 [bacterium]|nr:2-oxo acid dehydrogenase subunit E2 [bacterium]
MADKLLMLALSPTMETGTIAKWNKKEGDPVKSGDVLCEVETDKATMDYETSATGTLLKIIVPEGGQAAVGDLIAVMGKPGEDIAALLKGADARKTAATEKSAGQPAQKPAPQPATPAPDKPARPPAQKPAAEPPPQPAHAISRKELKSSPLARRLAEKMNIDLRSIAGSGPAGRIIKRDVERAMHAGRKAPAAPAPPAPAPAAQGLRDEVLPVSNKRRIIAQRLSESMYSAPHYYLKVTACADGLLEAREALNRSRGPAESVSLNAFLIKFAALALAKHPMVNASWQGDTIARHGRVDIGIAVALPDGLVTPVVRDCVNKGIIAIDRELKDLVDRARNNKLRPEEFTGATFTISNLGSFGIEEFTAIINPPAAAILAVGAAHRAFVPGPGGQPVARTAMALTLSCDHRVIDGAVGAAFLRDLKNTIGYPVEGLY